MNFSSNKSALLPPSPPAEGIEIALHDVNVMVGADFLLRGINLTLVPGEFTALTGPNGSGKSTLLNVIAAIGFKDKPPTSGEVTYNGLSVYDGSKSDRAKIRSNSIAFLLQDPKLRLDTNLTVIDNIRLSPNLRGVAIDEDALADSVDYYGIAHMLGRQVGQLSGGQKQIIPIVAAEATNPGVYLLDEPTASLSFNVADRVYERLRILSLERRKTVVIVSHERQQIAPRVIGLEHGKICSDNTTDRNSSTIEGPQLL